MLTQSIRSNLSCMFSCDGFNYDWIEANNCSSHRLPSLELPSSGFESLPASYKLSLEEQAYRQLHKVMTPSKADIVLAAKGERDSLTLDTIDARDTANRPDTIPADMSAMRVDYWKPAHKVFIPNKSVKPDASIKELAADKGGLVMSLPDLPQGTVLGVLSTEAWRRGEHSEIAIHQPKPLPAYKAPTRELTASEQQVAAWLAEGRKSKPATRSSRLAMMQARHWDKGDGFNSLQPVDQQNMAIRANVVAISKMAEGSERPTWSPPTDRTSQRKHYKRFARA